MAELIFVLLCIQLLYLGFLAYAVFTSALVITRKRSYWISGCQICLAMAAVRTINGDFMEAGLEFLLALLLFYIANDATK